MDAARRQLPFLDRDGQGSERQTRIDGPADGVANNEAGPGVQNDGDINEATHDGDVVDIGDPKLVGSIKRYGFGKVGKDRLVVVAIRRFCEAAPHSGLKVMLAHETADLLVIDDHSLLPEGGLDPAPAVVLELVTDCSHCCNDGGVVAAQIGSS
jgi:hypothetical protein